MNVSRRLAIVAIILAASPALRAQSNALQSVPGVQDENTAAKHPAYDVVSIKPDKSGSGSENVDSNNDSYIATNISLRNLLADAYGIKEDLISGVPGPIDSARFDIQAKIVDADPQVLKKLSNKQQRLMLLPFLEERFQLKVHMETKILPVYELIVTENGPKFKPTAQNSRGSGGTSIQNNVMTAHGVSMVSLADSLTGQVHRTVIDRTGLTDLYDLGMKWSTDDGSNFQTDTGPSIFTALEEQLGLKLKSAKGPVETLVVDHVAMPSAN